MKIQIFIFLSLFGVEYTYSQSIQEFNLNLIDQCKCLRQGSMKIKKDWLEQDSILSYRAKNFVNLEPTLDAFEEYLPEVLANPYSTDTITTLTTSNGFNHEKIDLGYELTYQSVIIYGGTITYQFSIVQYNRKILIKELNVYGNIAGIEYYKKEIIPILTSKIECNGTGLNWTKEFKNNIFDYNQNGYPVAINLSTESMNPSYKSLFNPMRIFQYEFCEQDDCYECALDLFIDLYKQGVSNIEALLFSPNPIARIYAIEALQYLNDKTEYTTSQKNKKIIDSHLAQKVKVTTHFGCFVNSNMTYGDTATNWTVISTALDEINLPNKHK